MFKNPSKNDTRTRRMFAFLPITTDNGESIWLQFYIIEEKYIQSVKTWISSKKEHPSYRWIVTRTFI